MEREKIRLFIVAPIIGSLLVIGMNSIVVAKAPITFYFLDDLIAIKYWIIRIFSWFITGYLIVALANLFSMLFKTS